ncbi:hypothetical protein M0R45_035769 [Rubus argutus]|uniref:Wall-associated receptor kinase galacturonan-binding domain-containing protein n=1 Tax=Rubus argutus TaxID=59490 RepID=A0AAW1VU35_RUBAR
MEIMGRSITLSCCLLIVAILVIPHHSLAGRSSCKPSWCGNFNISYPFRLKDDPKHCGQLLYTLSCDENNMTLLELPSSGKYYVQSIHYHNQTIRLIDPNLLRNYTVPRNLLPAYYMFEFPYTAYGYDYHIHTAFIISTPIFFIKCLNPPVTSSLYVSTAPCINVSDSYSYFKIGDMKLGDLNEGCSLEWMASTFLNISDHNYNNKATCKSIHDALSYGFQLQYFSDDELEQYYEITCRGQWEYDGKCVGRGIPGFFEYEIQSYSQFRE